MPMVWSTRTPKNGQDYVQEVAAANTYLGRFGITRGGGLQFQPQEGVCCELLAQEILEI